MAQIHDIQIILNLVPVEWQDDFCRLVEGGNPSEEFVRFFDENEDCQAYADKVLRLLDGGMVRRLFVESSEESIISDSQRWKTSYAK